MAKHLVDLDEDALVSARARLGTATIKETVNRALRIAGEERAARVSGALDVLARTSFADRGDAWA